MIAECFGSLDTLINGRVIAKLCPPWCFRVMSEQGRRHLPKVKQAQIGRIDALCPLPPPQSLDGNLNFFGIDTSVLHGLYQDCPVQPDAANEREGRGRGRGLLLVKKSNFASETEQNMNKERSPPGDGECLMTQTEACNSLTADPSHHRCRPNADSCGSQLAHATQTIALQYREVRGMHRFPYLGSATDRRHDARQCIIERASALLSVKILYPKVLACRLPGVKTKLHCIIPCPRTTRLSW